MAKTRSSDPLNARTGTANAFAQVAARYFRVLGLETPYRESLVLSRWEAVMGKPVALRTEKLRFEKGVLSVKISSAPLRKELSMSKTKVMDLLNEDVGHNTVKDIRFL